MAVSDNSILRFAAHFNADNASDIVNVYHAVIDSVGEVSEGLVVQDLLDLVQALMNNVSALYSASVVLDSVEAWVRNTALNRWDSIGSLNGTWLGTAGDTSELPAAVAPYLRADTVDAQAKGAKFLPPITEGSVADGIISGAGLVPLVAYLEDWTATYIGASAEYAQGIWQESTQTFKAFTGTGTVSNVPAYQRRRKPGVGE